jgi:hypothetical protein
VGVPPSASEDSDSQRPTIYGLHHRRPMGTTGRTSVPAAPPGRGRNAGEVPRRSPRDEQSGSMLCTVGIKSNVRSRSTEPTRAAAPDHSGPGQPLLLHRIQGRWAHRGGRAPTEHASLCVRVAPGRYLVQSHTLKGAKWRSLGILTVHTGVEGNTPSSRRVDGTHPPRRAARAQASQAEWTAQRLHGRLAPAQHTLCTAWRTSS